MRRFSLLLALAVILLAGGVGYTYKLRMKKAGGVAVTPTPAIKIGQEASAFQGWQYHKDNPETNKPVVWVDAQSFQATKDPSTFELHGLALKLFDKSATDYTYVTSERALFDEGTGLLKSEGAVWIVMNVPADREGSDKKEAAKHVQVQTTGVSYETKTGKAVTDQLANFIFSNQSGGGTAVGAEYDPNTKVLHMKSQVKMDWIGKGKPEDKMHIETSDLVYKEAEQKVYLTPAAKLFRHATTIQCNNAVVTLLDQRIHQVDGTAAVGADDRQDRHTAYAADILTALFNEDGVLVNIVGNKNAKVTSTQPSSKTTLTSDRADMRFAVTDKVVSGEAKEDSTLHLVLADGHALAVAEPLGVQPGASIPDTRSLRSEHIELEMKPDGRDLQEIRTSSQAQMEFKPNQPGLPHRVVDASHLRVLYGAGSYVDTFLAWDAVTRTDKPAAVKAGKKTEESKPALTWSDQLTAKFQANSNQVGGIDQVGHFRYEEGTRKASAKSAHLDQIANRMTLTDNARVLDDTGSAFADRIIMNQASGDMDAQGHVFSTHAPDKNEKPGTTMLDNSKAMQAKADSMQTRVDNTCIHYEGHAVMWQGANRTMANSIDIDRNQQTMHAQGNVASELLDNKDDTAQAGAPGGPPLFTTVYAPDMVYRDDTRISNYTGGVKLTRGKMVITSNQLQAYLSPKTEDHKDDSSLDHAVATGDVTVFQQTATNRTRTSTSDRCEYWTKDDKVVLNGGKPQMVDSLKGVTKGDQLTYFNHDDRLIVDGKSKKLAFTQMKMK